MGFSFIIISPLLPSSCGFSFVFGSGVSFLVGSSIPLWMIVQQLVAISVLSQEEMSTRPSMPPSWFNLLGLLLFSHSVMSSSLWPHGLKNARLPCPSLSPGLCSNSCPLFWWCRPTILPSVAPFSSCPPSFPASGFFPMSQYVLSWPKNSLWPLCKMLRKWGSS